MNLMKQKTICPSIWQKNQINLENLIPPEEAFDYLENLYSHIEIIGTQYRTNYIDLEKSYINYTAIIKIEDKYYSFDWYYTWNWDFEDQVDANADLTEVFPKEVTVTEYESK